MAQFSKGKHCGSAKYLAGIGLTYPENIDGSYKGMMQGKEVTIRGDVFRPVSQPALQNRTEILLV